jgi:DNA adenine methylase
MYSNKLYTPLRYPGGKAKFAPFIAKIMESNDLAGGHYLEPYAGGAGVALELLYHGYAGHVHINDLDPAVHAFWIAATTQPEELLRLVNDTPVTMDEWFKWRSILRGDRAADATELGFATLFLNRTNRSGILKAGVIGGIDQLGNYKLDARYKKDVLKTRIEKIASHSSRISVYCSDALVLLRDIKAYLPKRSLVYLDPPYYVKGRGLYRNFYRHEDHVAIAKLLQNSRFNRSWVVSYDNAPEICDMYSASGRLDYSLHYTAQERYVGKEVMFFSDGLKFSGEELPQSNSSKYGNEGSILCTEAPADAG